MLHVGVAAPAKQDGSGLLVCMLGLTRVFVHGPVRSGDFVYADPAAVGMAGVATTHPRSPAPDSSAPPPLLLGQVLHPDIHFNAIGPGMPQAALWC